MAGMQTWAERFPDLFAADHWAWGELDVRFQIEVPPDELISNVHVIGRTGEGIVVCSNDLG
jgi:8-oxo-dGTP diphosphatase